MRKSMSLLVLNLLLGSVACEISTGDEDDDDRSGQGANGRDAGNTGTPVDPNGSTTTGDAGSKTADAGSQTTADAGQTGNNGGAADSGVADAGPIAPPTPATDTFKPLAQCGGFTTASVACDSPDLLEPNDQAANAIALDARDGCALVAGKMSSQEDVDYYVFSSPRHDPVRLRLGYETTATGRSNIIYHVTDALGSDVSYGTGTRQALTAVWTDAFVVKKDIAHTIRIDDNGTTSCQGYNLLIEPNFCTDSFEDNDTREASKPGLVYGTTLTATAFSDDEDWYDLTAIQTAGAKCVVTAPQITLTSKESVRWDFNRGDNSTVDWGELDSTDAGKSITFTLPAGSGAAFMRVLGYGEVCIPYTVTCSPL